MKAMQRTKAKLDENGLVSIIVTMIIIIVLTLIVLSFAQISRREQRNSLDRQLSAQAFYAAESGVNDAIRALKQLPASSSIWNTKYMNDCNGFRNAVASEPSVTPPLTPTLTGSGQASYTCLFVDPAPHNVVIGKSDTTHVFPLESVGGVNIGDLEIYWDDGSGGNNFAGCPAPRNHPTTKPGNCDASILRFEVVDSSNLSTNKVFFIYPGTGAQSPAVGFGSATGAVTKGTCTNGGTPNRCRAVINLPGPRYIIRVNSIYGPAALDISAVNAAIQLKGAQALIDATGRATDVLRRIQVRTPTNDLEGEIPDFALGASDKICKQYSLLGSNPPYVSDTGDCWVGANPD